MSLDYKEIIEDFRKGKEPAMKQLYNCFFVSLSSYAHHFVPNDLIVQDIVQETFIKLWDRRNNFFSIFSIRAFLYTTVRNACLNEIRAQHNRRKVSLSETVLSVEENFIVEEEVLRMITAEIQALPMGMRKVFEMSLLNLSVKEIAENLNISEYTARNQKASAKKKLQNKLKDWMFLLFL